MNINMIQHHMETFTDNQVCHILQGKPQHQQYLTYEDLQRLGTAIEGEWIQRCGETPDAIKSAILMSQAVLSNHTGTKIAILKRLLSSGGLAAGLAIILSNLGPILGSSVIPFTVLKTFIVMSPVSYPTAPVMLPIGIGAAIFLLSRYLMHSNLPEEVLSNKAIQLLKKGIHDALPCVWHKYESKWNND